MSGYVSITGAGPGDPELLTIKALKVLQSADVVLYDRLVNLRLLEVTRVDCEKIYVGKDYGQHSLEQGDINNLLCEKARQGKKIVRLKGGDPFIFGRGFEEALALAQAKIPFEIIPGISSSYAVPALAGIPLTHRGVAASFTVVTGHGAKAGPLQLPWTALAQIDTVVFLMGVKRRHEIARQLVSAGKPESTPIAFATDSGDTGKKLVRGQLKDLISDKFPEVKAPAVFIIGAVVTLADQFLNNGQDLPDRESPAR